MIDRKLADRIVALGIGKKLDELYYSWGQQADKFVRDWRVAGALMERCHAKGWTDSFLNPDGVAIVFTDRDEPHDISEAKNESLPRAICEACCEALGGGDE